MIGKLKTKNMGDAVLDDDCVWHGDTDELTDRLNSHYSLAGSPAGDPAIRALFKAAENLDGVATVDPEFDKMLEEMDPDTIY